MRAFAEKLLNNKNRDFSLDLLRALSCIMVVGVHINQRFNMPGILGEFFEKGSTGVSFFFILSGYLAYVSMDRIFNEKGITFKGILRFWIKRNLHILPLYYIVILFYFIFHTLMHSYPVDESGLYWIRYIFLINLWVPTGEFFWLNLGAVWTISVFVFFYLVAPLFYVLIRRYYVAWIALILFYGCFDITTSVGTGMLPFRYLFYFVLGILIYLAGKEERELGMVAVLFFLLIFFYLTGGGTALVSPFLAALFLIACRGKAAKLKQDGLLRALVTYISTISYSVYLVHLAVLTVLDVLSISNAVLYLAVFFVTTIILSTVTYNQIEVRFARWAETKLFDLLGI